MKKIKTKRKKIHIAVLMGGRSGEHEVSLASGRAVLKNLNKNKYNVLPITITKNGVWQTRYTKNTIETLNKLKKVDVVIIMLHGPYGEDGTVQGLLELFNLPYVGAGVFSSALCMNKLKTKEIMKANKILIPDYISFSKTDWQRKRQDILTKIIKKIGFPNVVKPNNLGSSLGITIPKNITQLKKGINFALKYTNQILVEQYIKGKEIHCGILGNKKPFALPLDLVKPKNEFYDYEAKYNKNGAIHFTPAPLSKTLTKMIQKQAIKIYQLVEGEGMARVDFLVDGKKIYFNEVNTIPGFTDTSILPKEAKIYGINFPKLLDLLIKYAFERFKEKK